MKFEPIKPPYRGFPASGFPREALVCWNTFVIKHPQAGRAYERDTATDAKIRWKIRRQIRQDFFFSLHETWITHEGRKRLTPLDADMFERKVLQRPIPTLMKGDEDRHHLAGV